MTILPAPPAAGRACPHCQHDAGRLDIETCPECGTSLAPACIICGYDLKGLPREGVCPECGTPVEQSYVPDLLENRSQEYLRQLKGGLSWVLNAILVMVCLVVLGIFAAFTGLPGIEWIVSVVMIACSLAGLYGWWRVTTPDPGKAGAPDLRSRQLIRTAVVVQAAAAVSSAGAELVGPGVGAGGGASGATVLDVATILLIVVEVVSTVAWVVQFFAAMMYVRWLARRIPDQKLHTQAKRFMWLGPLLQTVGLLLLGLGPLIALVMYWNMLDKLRKHLKRFLAAA